MNAPIQHHWSAVQARLTELKLSEGELAFCREMFFGGALSMLAILMEVSRQCSSDRDFNTQMDALFREASTGVLDRYVETYLQPLSERRH